jgi:hypothetical protein
VRAVPYFQYIDTCPESGSTDLIALKCIRIQSVSEFQILESTIQERKAGLFTRTKCYLGWNECCKAEPLCPFHSSNGEFCSVPHLACQWR